MSIERSTATFTLTEIIDELTEIRDVYGSELYVKPIVVVSVDKQRLSDGSEVYDVIIAPRK